MDALTSPWKVEYKFADDDKAKFAAALLLDPAEPFKAAVATFGPGKDDIGKCSWVAAFWPEDREVIALQIDLIGSKGAKSFLPSKEEAQRRVWQWTQAGDVDDRIKAMRLLADISDWIPKPGTAVTVNVQNNVMEVPVAPSDDAWERAAARQQDELVQAATAVH